MSPIRIMTANLWAHKVDVDGFGALVDRIDPDVLAVQELQVPAAAEVMARYRYHGLVAHHDTLGNGIATRYPADISRLPMAYRSGWAARLDPGGWPDLTVPLEVLCVHLGNPVTFPWRRAVDRRRRQLADLLPRIDTGADNLVVVGDFNATPRWPLYRALAEQLGDGAVESGSPAATWSWHGIGPPLLRIDHALTRGVTTLRSQTHRIPGSDHRALVVEVAERDHQT
jgi:endonuclease/exonuclease/phosphatase (EEP) superfamily protein YafD